MAAINTAFIVLILSAVVYGKEEVGPPRVLICNIDFASYMEDYTGNFTLEQLDPHLCTHIMYNKARADEINRDIVPKYPSMDLYDNGGRGMYNKTMKLKEANPQLKVIIQLCCLGPTFWDNSTMPYDVIISTFIKNSVAFMQRHGFDGLYITLTNHTEELRLLTGLREEFDKRGFLLLTFLFPVELIGVTDPIVTRENVGAFDYVLLVSEWFLIPEKTNIYYSVNATRNTISKCKQEGLPEEKLVVLIETFAECYKLCNASDNGLSAPICDIERGLTYVELMYNIRNGIDGWVAQRDNETGMFYGHSDSLEWTTFEDTVSVREKVQYVLEENLAGVGIMSVDMDDNIGYNEEGVILPLTRAAHDALRGI